SRDDRVGARREPQGADRYRQQRQPDVLAARPADARRHPAATGAVRRHSALHADAAVFRRAFARQCPLEESVMQRLSTGLLLGVVVALVLVLNALFTVDEREWAIKFRLGEIIRSDYEPGLHFKVPFINNVRTFDRRIQHLDSRTERFLTVE